MNMNFVGLMFQCFVLRPALYLPSPDKVTVAVRCCPQKFQLRKVPRNLHIDPGMVL